MLQWRIGDSPAGIPFTDSWNASLWTLAWEFLCYLGLLGLGVLGMLQRRWILPTAFAVSLVLSVLMTIPDFYVEAFARIGRFSIFFLAGALVAQYSTLLKGSWALALGLVALAIACSWLPPVAIIVQAPLTATGLILLGGLANPRWAELRNDISYGVYIYAFPVQQLLVVIGLVSVGLWAFSAIALLVTIPLAAASWFAIEKPALRLRVALGYRPWFRPRLDAGGTTYVK